MFSEVYADVYEDTHRTVASQWETDAQDKQTQRVEALRAHMEFEAMKGYIPGYKEWKKSKDAIAADEERRVQDARQLLYMRKCEAA